MFMTFFSALRQAGTPVTLREYLTLLEALDRDVIERRVEDFYYLARAALVKDERFYDRFDQVFARVFQGVERLDDGLAPDRAEAWLGGLAQRDLTREDLQLIEALGGLDALLRALADRLKARPDASEAGSAGRDSTSPLGAGGFHPEGQRLGQDHGRHGKAIKVWDRRDFRGLDERSELSARNIKLALRRLRRFARQGAADELDLDGTIRDAADKGYLDLVMRAPRRNAVKVLALFDIGGSMDSHVAQSQQLFAAARGAFKTFDFFYFHNCLYERVWKDPRRRDVESMATRDLLNTYGRDYKIIFVGDASMSPFEITHPGGSVEHWNAEPGAAWLERVGAAYERVAWLNPADERHWDYSPSIGMIRQLVGGRMYPLTLQGLDMAMRALSR